MERLMLLDANGIIYRAYFALQTTPLTTSKGQLVNAVFGFWSIVLRGFQDVRPDYVICAFDLAGPTFRHAQFADYKATRREMPDDLRDQFPIVREIVEAFRIPVYQYPGYEADDVIGTLVKQAEVRGLETTIVSGDLDMLQLVSDRTSVMTTRGGVQMTVVYDPARIRERYGLTAGQMIDFKALKGDTTDNIPGIPGVGEKTAAKLLQDFASLDGIYADLEAVKPDKLRDKLLEHREQVFASRELVTLHCDLPVELDLEPARLGDYDRNEVLRLFREYEFRSLVERLPEVLGEEKLAPGELLRQADRSDPVPAAIVPGRVLAAERRAVESGGVGTAGSGGGRSLSGEGTGLQLSLDFGALGGSTGDGGRSAPGDGGRTGTDDGEGARAPVAADADGADTSDIGELLGSPAASNGRAPIEAMPGDARSRVAAALRDPSLVERFQPDADLTGWLRARRELAVGVALDDPRPRRGTILGLAVAGEDGRVVAAESAVSDALLDQLLASGTPVAGHEIKQLFVAELARRDPEATASPNDPRLAAPLPGVSFDTQIAAYILNAALRSQSLADISAERLGVELPKPGELRGPEHAAIEALAVAAARETLAPRLDEEGLRRLYEEIELPLIPVLASLEANGVVIDRHKLGELDAVFSQEIGRLEEEIFESVGHRFTIGSPKQLEQVLFYELNLPRGKRTKTGYSTDASVLEDLRAAHPAVEKILDWRLYTKLKSTYVDALPLLIDEHTGRLHTTFHQAVATTGRLSSTDPNLQNIPIRTELGRRIRGAFVAGREDRVLLAADYSQIELRILAHVSGDVHLREAFERKADIHRETAARVLHKDPANVTHAERSMAKMVNFGIAYGMSDYGLSTRAGIPRAEAQEFINRYFATYSGISYYMLHIKDVARRQGYVTTLLGRRRWIPELEARNQTLRSAGERMAINMPIQGTAADIMKIALIRVAERLRRERSETRLLLTVHDELLMEVPRSESSRIAPVIRETMEAAMPLDVPLVVDLKAGADWDSLTPVETA